MPLDKLVLLPHIASATRESRPTVAHRVLDKLQGFFADGSLISAAP